MNEEGFERVLRKRLFKDARSRVDDLFGHPFARVEIVSDTCIDRNLDFSCQKIRSMPEASADLTMKQPNFPSMKKVGRPIL